MATPVEAVWRNLPTKHPWSVIINPPAARNQRINSFPGRNVVMVNNYRLASEVLDERRFHKTVAGALKEIRILVGDGLFTAYDGEPNWAIARQYSFILIILHSLFSSQLFYRPCLDARLRPCKYQRNVRRHVRHCHATCLQVGKIRP